MHSWGRAQGNRNARADALARSPEPVPWFLEMSRLVGVQLCTNEENHSTFLLCPTKWLKWYETAFNSKERNHLEMAGSKITEGQEPEWNLQMDYIGPLSETPASYKWVLTRIMLLDSLSLKQKQLWKKQWEVWNSGFSHSTSLDIILLIKLGIYCYWHARWARSTAQPCLLLYPPSGKVGPPNTHESKPLIKDFRDRPSYFI